MIISQFERRQMRPPRPPPGPFQCGHGGIFLERLPTPLTLGPTLELSRASLTSPTAPMIKNTIADARKIRFTQKASASSARQMTRDATNNSLRIR